MRFKATGVEGRMSRRLAAGAQLACALVGGGAARNVDAAESRGAPAMPVPMSFLEGLG